MSLRSIQRKRLINYLEDRGYQFPDNVSYIDLVRALHHLNDYIIDIDVLNKEKAIQIVIKAAFNEEYKNGMQRQKERQRRR